MAKPTKQQVEDVLEEVGSHDLPDWAHWMMCHERLGLECGDLVPLMEEYGLFDEAPTT